MAKNNELPPIDSDHFNKWWGEVNRLLARESETEMLYGRAKYWWADRMGSRLAPCETARYEIVDRQKGRIEEARERVSLPPIGPMARR